MSNCPCNLIINFSLSNKTVVSVIQKLIQENKVIGLVHGDIVSNTLNTINHKGPVKCNPRYQKLDPSH